MIFETLLILKTVKTESWLFCFLVFKIQNRTTARFEETRETEQYLDETHGIKMTAIFWTNFLQYKSKYTFGIP
jgi:hypothetical protein